MARPPAKAKKEFLATVADLARSLRDRIEAEVDGFDPDPKARETRKARAAGDVLYFGQTYFPHKVKGQASAFHIWLTERMGAVAHGQGGAREVTEAPRGNAKTTWGEIFVTYCVVHNLKHFVVFLSDSLDQAATMLEAVKAELDTNPRLAMDFPDACGEGPVWQVAEVVTANGVKIKAGGARKRLRGMRYGAHRPDLVWSDDLENDENIKSPEQRQKLEEWINKAVEPLGPPDGSMDIWIVGTVLHPDAVIQRLSRNPLWQARRFQAIIDWPERMDLWETWEGILRNHGREAADAFHRENQGEMERGAQVLWPQVQTLLKLMVIRVRVGDAAFQSEYQNDPMNAEDCVFSTLTTWTGLVSILRAWKHFGSCDPSLGKNNKGRDPSAILVGAVDEDGDRLYVVEALIRRRVPDKIISDIISLQGAYRCMKWGIETIQFQEFLRTTLIARSIKERCPVPAYPLTPHSDKVARIEAIQPYVEAGFIQFSPAHTVLLEQLRHFPRADHDDGPDALEMLWSLAMTGAVDVTGFRTAGQGRGGDMASDWAPGGAPVIDGDLGRVPGRNWRGW
ncbi:phage terminase large subunit [Rhodospirillum sp. A1_3_36]|uniref:phage terminase large subunit n=1 Tax=Rhodospirillum sp. A1_3_36 TaxID=3391666 RepID=UPI0039A71969